MFGWAPLMRVLQHQGFYAGQCPNSTIGDCDSAKLKYNAIFTAGSFGATAGALVFGLVFDRIGLRWSSVVGHCLLCSGILMLTFSTNKRK